MKKRILSILLALVMLVCLLPMTALADTEVEAFNLVLMPPETGYYPSEAYAGEDEYSYSTPWLSLHVQFAETTWTYLDEYNVEHTIAYPETMKPETVYTAHVKLILYSGYKFANPPQITLMKEAVELETWDTEEPWHVTIKKTYPATEPLQPIERVEVTAVEPLCDAYINDTVECEYHMPYAVDYAAWYNSAYVLQTPLDKYLGAETYILTVGLKAKDYAKFTTDLKADACVLNPDWLGEGKSPSAIRILSPVLAELDFVWTVPEPISHFDLFTAIQAYGEHPVIYAWAEPGAGYEVRASRYYDGYLDDYMDGSEVLEQSHFYRMECDVYPAEGYTFASTVSATLNGADGTYYQNNISFFTIYFPISLMYPLPIFEADVNYSEPVDVGLYASDSAKVPAGVDYDILNVVWYDEADNDIYGFDFEDGKSYTLKITLTPNMTYAFDQNAVFRFNGETVEAIEDGRERIIAVPFHVSSWSPIVVDQAVFDLSGGGFGDFSAQKDTLKALDYAGLIKVREVGTALYCDLDLDGKEDFYCGPSGTDSIFDFVYALEDRALEGEKTLTLNAAALDYLKAKLVPVYYESIKFYFPPLVWNITFDSNGGGGAMPDDTVVRGLGYTLPACTFTPPVGKEFEKWDKGMPGTEIAVGADITIKAIWKDKPVEYWTVTLDANDGSGTIAPVSVEKGKKYTLPNCPFTAPAGKEFEKWDKGMPGTEIAVSSDMTIKAIWKDKPAEYWTVSFDAGGGSGTMSPVSVEKGKKYTLPACTFTAPAGKEFDEWDEGAPGEEITVTENLTVFALWKPKATKSNPFLDVLKTDYFYDAVLWAYYTDPQVTNGIDSTHFGPSNTVTRGQAVTFLWRAMGCPEPNSKDNPFEDVTEGKYFYKAVLWAMEKGITNGTDATHFTPNQTCSTAHIITFLFRTITGRGNEGWYQVAEAWAQGAGLLKGLDISVAPGVECPRSDVVLFLYRQLAE